ncbi:MAG: hypothetical protein ONB48_21795 [candidate division KSB1 bacterium]|nr:hypothetical protein [candidate division KSB1 bacterium]MDZ7288283.1 hypothetical protein [candidate division KSB1 bacterium]MDZ7300493.1 hypothetical protein [candidate division KSB1 bacterium]MDZ7308074.1 hypothetical protein [candidate division KSB1 bacterium]MDZ7351491.1 hypothetical protein [candidate division KSB1 bacterium]
MQRDFELLIVGSRNEALALLAKELALELCQFLTHTLIFDQQFFIRESARRRDHALINKHTSRENLNLISCQKFF